MGEFIGLIAVAGAFCIPLLAIWTRHQKDLRVHGGSAEGDAAQLAEQVELLQERVQVLERIVTDKGYDVASQIEALRDTRRIDELLEDSSKREANQ
ncbi:MAG: hypothetical protein P0Y56_14395 [Candidatus Andeanibacterium colombiense]|uniref:Phage shock protein B n=1 Tax=Candidatus Andeanibacterium colombiense TaxID=3121345 RepID=A0AAJ5X560_9SPHN|nr:MAG: hypothetical protein P0Y56_14395 [Sphingomonadaceae bacterium]